MSCIDLAEIPAIGCGSNAAGNTTLYLIKKESVTFIPAPTNLTHTIAVDVTLAALAAWSKIAITGSTLGVVDTLEGEFDHQSWKTEISFEIPKIRDEVLYQLNGWVGMELIAVVVDNNGTQRIMGDLARPCKLTVAVVDTGKTGTDKNHHQVTLMVVPNSNHSSYIYTGEVVPY